MMALKGKVSDIEKIWDHPSSPCRHQWFWPRIKCISQFCDCKTKDVALPQWGKMRVCTLGYCRKAAGRGDFFFFLEVYSH